MLTYNMDVTPESIWKRTTLSEAERAQPYSCTEAGLFYAQQRFSTARTDKESYILFYTSGVPVSSSRMGTMSCWRPGRHCCSTAARHRATAPHRGRAAGTTTGCIWTVPVLRPWSRCFCPDKN